MTRLIVCLIYVISSYVVVSECLGQMPTSQECTTQDSKQGKFTTGCSEVLGIVQCNNRRHLSNAVPVTIYYETLCSDSVYFITRQLYPNYHYFKNYVTIDFIPYGKSLHSYNATTGKYSFSCHHGKEECRGNKFHACALAQIEDKDTQLEFIVCVMSTRNPANIYYVERCAQKYNLDFTKLATCAMSSEGDKLLASHGDKTWKLEPNIYFVPTVVFNNSALIDAKDQDRSMADFKDIVCKKIMEKKPDICATLGFFDRIKNYFSSR